MGLVHLRIKEITLKIKWVHNYFSNPQIRAIADRLLLPEIKEFIWSANLRKEDIKLFIMPGFWADVLEARMTYVFINPKNQKAN